MQTCKLFLSLSLTLLFFSPPSFAGREVGNGGNGIVSEFFVLYEDFQNPEYQTCFRHISSMTLLNEMQKLRWQLKVEIRDQLQLDGTEVGAINYPNQNPPLLLISESQWMKLNSDQKAALALHELIHLSGYNDTNFSFSSKILQCIQSRKKKADIHGQVSRWALETCKTEIIPSLNRQELAMALSLDDPSAYWEPTLLQTLIDRHCLAGLRALQKHSLLKMTENSRTSVCIQTKGLDSATEITHTAPEILNFLEILLTDFQKEIDLKSCVWTMCLSSGFALEIEKRPAVNQICDILHPKN